MLDSTHVILDSYAGYDTGHKANDATSNNNSGHDRFLRGFLSYKEGSNYIGAGMRWSELSTTNYSKGGPIYDAGSWHPELGVGHDFNSTGQFYPSFMRLQLAYMFRESKEVVHYPNGVSCQGCGNGEQGLDLSMWFPSPSRASADGNSLWKRHLFYRFNLVLFRYHDSITEPKNIPLTLMQEKNRHWGDSTEFNLFWRF